MFYDPKAVNIKKRIIFLCIIYLKNSADKVFVRHVLEFFWFEVFGLVFWVDSRLAFKLLVFLIISSNLLSNQSPDFFVCCGASKIIFWRGWMENPGVEHQN